MNTLTLLEGKPQTKPTLSTRTAPIPTLAPRPEVIKDATPVLTEIAVPSFNRAFRSEIFSYSYSALND